MAAFASDMVGTGILGGKSLDIYVDSNVRRDGHFSPSSRLNVTDLDNMLIEGNKAVYRDIYWQHLAYKAGGLNEVIKYVSRSNQPRADLLIEGWVQIAAGDKSHQPGFVWAGNTQLLKFEQMVTLQRIYDRYPRLASRLSYVMISPLPLHFAPFRVFNFHGNIASFSDRWRWITEALLPEWQRLDASSMLSYVRLIYLGNFPKPLACFGG